ncbi:hypothetical protein ElyMa_004368400 [Elysia marginata]|uniref:Uncharacterized protein n=1 Tax=Elysia marginata TaxID=1093978 RepID=A0AAV4H7J3_9GAST|nr:hypothetical protein ElyMa_004368400 [Elysia marginata]
METSSLRRTQSMPAISTEAVGNFKKSIRSQSAPTKLDYSVCTSGLSLKSSRALNDTSIPPSKTLPTGDFKKKSITKTDEENLIQARQQLLTEAESLRHDDPRYSDIGEELRKTLIHPLSLPEGIELAPEVEKALRDIIKTADNYCLPADDELLNILPSDNHEITVSDSDSSSDSDNDNDSERKRYFIEDYRETKSHHPSHSALKILTNTHDFYQAGRNGVISVTCGHIPKEPFDPYFLTKKNRHKY